MCEEAHKYGIHVIVDVVANHFCTKERDVLPSYFPEDIRNNPDCWHEYCFEPMDNINREKITDYSISSDGTLPDLNTENESIQAKVISFLMECISLGADGFRFDSAKNIGTRADGEIYTFWENVIPQIKEFYKEYGYYNNLYCYGEVLGDSGALNNKDVIDSYLSHINLTCDDVGTDILQAVQMGDAAGTQINDFCKGDAQVPADKTVLWAESFKTYMAFESEAPEYTSAFTHYTDINKTWALLAARADATALYFPRPDSTEVLGNIGSTASLHWKDDEVVEVNRFHNAMNGEPEHLDYNNDISYVERGTRGAVLVNLSSNNTESAVDVPANSLADGTYKDQITGNTFTVSDGRITGTMGSTGIAVIYNEETGPSLRAVAEDRCFEDTLKVTLRSKGMTKAHFVTAEGDSGDFTGRMDITIGNKAKDDSVISIVLTGEDNDGNSYQEQFDFYK